MKRLIRSVLAKAGYEPTANRAGDLEGDAAFMALLDDCGGFTMTSPERMYGLFSAVKYIVGAEIPGDLVECGVWRGGSSMLVARTLLASGDAARRLWLYDTFEGMVEPTEKDVDFQGRSVGEILQSHGVENVGELCHASLDDVRQNMSATGYAADKIEYVQGKVEETIPARIPERIALLRLDTDWYESTLHELEHLYPRLVRGGVLIIDDYGHWQGAREATDYYFAEHRVRMLLNRLDYTGRLGVKLD